jgi:predicted nucleic acid-binding Zn ribbon protein
MGFNRFSDILKKIQAGNPVLAKRIQEAEALTRWEVAVGPAIAKHSRAIRIQDSVLWIEVDHPVWKTELHYRKRQILDLLNRVPTEVKAGAKPVELIKDLLLLDARPPRKTNEKND